jgi:hypothetical protein
LELEWEWGSWRKAKAAKGKLEFWSEEGKEKEKKSLAVRVCVRDSKKQKMAAVVDLLAMDLGVEVPMFMCRASIAMEVLS